MLRTLIISAALAALACGSAFAADEIEGRWKTQPGDTAAISDCGNGFCITLKDGDYAGQQVGQVVPSGDGRYVGSITNPEDGKTYKGKGMVARDSLKISGCALGGLVCKSQTWFRL